MAEKKSSKLPFILIGVIAVVIIVILVVVFSGMGDAGAGLPNPAAVYCLEQDGNYTYIDEHAYCVFPNDSKCPAWDYFNNTCTPGVEEEEDCLPDTCVGYECGTRSDGCGRTLNCGTCRTGYTCTDGQCLEEDTSTSVDGVGVELTAYEDVALGYLSHTYMYSDAVDVAAGQAWSKDTKVKVCIRYKSNVVDEYFRNAILYCNSSLWSEHTFQIDVLEYASDYYCGSWSLPMGGGTYQIQVPLNRLASNNDTFHEVCIDDINSELSNCVSEWGISDSEAYLTSVYQASVSSPIVSDGDYSIIDYLKIFVNDVQVSNSVFPNQEFNEFSGVKDDDEPDDFTGWAEYWNAYAVSAS